MQHRRGEEGRRGGRGEGPPGGGVNGELQLVDEEKIGMEGKRVGEEEEEEQTDWRGWRGEEALKRGAGQ